MRVHLERLLKRRYLWEEKLAVTLVLLGDKLSACREGGDSIRGEGKILECDLWLSS